jgi:hypothetical protein
LGFAGLLIVLLIASIAAAGHAAAVVPAASASNAAVIFCLFGLDDPVAYWGAIAPFVLGVP